MNTDTFSIDDIDWEEIILCLTAFTRSWTNNRVWFRGNGTSDFLAGKKVDDYVYEAITRYLEAPEKFNPGKGSLLDYLKYQLVRTLVGNDLRSVENRKTDDIFVHDNDASSEEEDNTSYLERVLPATAAFFPDDIDYQAIKVYIETEIQGDVDAENVFLGVYLNNMKRREVMEEFDMTANAFDNGIRRLNTVLKRATLHFSEKRPTI